MAKKTKFYVVWIGHEPGIYFSWADCQLQINGYPNARYKSFASLELAKAAYEKGHEEFWGKEEAVARESLTKQMEEFEPPIGNSIAVDGAWNTKTGLVEYQGVYTETQTELFREGPFEDGTNNIAEFLAIVHALAYCKQHRMEDLPIYSDSKTALSWIRQKKCKTKHSPSNKNKKLFQLIARAEKWLQTNKYNNELLKWETKYWGENPADFGRK